MYKIPEHTSPIRSSSSRLDDAEAAQSRFMTSFPACLCSKSERNGTSEPAKH